jgi:addiction module RelE/StbE family toxin
VWSFWRSNRFKHRYRKITKKNPLLSQATAEALEKLQQSENPLSLGEQKRGPLKDYWAYPLNDQCRILYNISKPTKEINLHRICSHTESYEN